MTYVVCVGLATQDTILVVPRHSEADELVFASDATVAGGGPAATAAVALARLGVRRRALPQRRLGARRFRPLRGRPASRAALDRRRQPLEAGAELVVVTRGERGCAAYTSGGEIDTPATPLLDPVSTLGAGDVFHGALLAALIHEQPLAQALAFANGVAALSCRALDGRSAIPTIEEVG